MAKKKTTTAAADAPVKDKKVREKKAPKDSYLKDNYVQINLYGNVKTSAMYVRGVGTMVREEVLDSKGDTTAVASTFMPGVKIKSKKDWKYLIIDKGPKSRKGKLDPAEEEDEEEEENEAGE